MAALGLGLVAIATPASAGSISSGALTLTMEDSPFFVKGAQETLTNICGEGWQPYEGGLVRQQLSATSPYGIASWDVGSNYNYSGPGPWTHYAQSTRPVIIYPRDNYDDSCGGGVHNGQGVIVRVTDKHGNVAELAEMASMYFVRWDSTAADGNVILGTFGFGSAWAANNQCALCDNGSTIYTKKPGASAVFTLSSDWTNLGPGGGPTPTRAHLGLVMTEGPGHGAVKVYLDGVFKATIDTYSKTWKYRTYVYDFAVPTAGAHTVKLVNVGTKGRPRIDVQGMGIIEGGTYVPSCDFDTCS